ncbi:3-hydroxyacyl-CoA dehydrogenase NAD-binding domain-containing protein, partial [Staphylococcus aureus]|nr:3-hydroxyacyl-CoA dehydrogenase NAD-binding domain-containing protein [Staphylococcus aureus]
MTPTLNILGLVGTGVMGSGIAQIAAQAGLTVRLFDARDGAARSARTSLSATFDKLVAKGKIEAVAAAAALERLQVADTLEALA